MKNADIIIIFITYEFMAYIIAVLAYVYAFCA